MRHRWLAMCSIAWLWACTDEVAPGTLVINEVVSSNEGAAIDELGEADDYIELANLGPGPARLASYTIVDRSGARASLPDLSIPAGGVIVLWADDTPEQGPLHLPFKVSASGDEIVLEHEDGSIADSVLVPKLATNDAFVRIPSATGALGVCRFASPGRTNPSRCEPAAPPELADEVAFSPFTWPEPWPEVRGPLVLSELALRPARAVEVLNASGEPITLAEFSVRLAPQAPGEPWPSDRDGVALAWPDDVRTLAPGGRVVLDVPPSATAAIEEDAAFEGVATIFGADADQVIDRVEFMHWPESAALARLPDATGRPRLCNELTLGEPNERCEQLRSRPVGDRLRNLYTEGDFQALARGDTGVSTLGVKFVVDLEAGGVVHFLSSAAWALHYTFVREAIDRDPPLDRCDRAQATEFDAGWAAFSQAQYLTTEGRRYLLGTLEHHPGSDLWTVAYTLGDRISAPQMLQGFFAVMAHIQNPRRFALRPSEPRQITLMQAIDGRAPIVGMNAPYQGVVFQALTQGVGFGTLTFVPASELGDAPLGRDVIVVTDDVPNDIPLIGGLITEAMQTPLAHVNILSKNRGTPNMALRGARHAAELTPLFGELVKLEVEAGGFSVRRATAEEADAFFEERRPRGERVAPRLNLSVRGVQPLAGKSLADLPAIGAKAAQLAELSRVPTAHCGSVHVPIPRDPFAIPVVHSLEHYEASGALELLRQAEATVEFRADPAVRAAVLDQVRARILSTPVDPALLDQVIAHLDARFGERRVRFRSSSNTEDLPTFNGAGLYTSLSAELGDPERAVDDAMRTVWASLFSLRAYDEREVAHIDQRGVAMGILVHPAFLSERANAVAISRNLLDPVRADIHYFNAQRGEASVANPAPGVVTEQVSNRLFVSPQAPSLKLEYHSRSSFSPDAPVLSVAEIDETSCYLRAIHARFQNLLDPQRENRWFAIDIELKRVGEARALLIKQARPYSFGKADVPADCREFF